MKETPVYLSDLNKVAPGWRERVYVNSLSLSINRDNQSFDVFRQALNQEADRTDIAMMNLYNIPDSRMAKYLREYTEDLVQFELPISESISHDGEHHHRVVWYSFTWNGHQLELIDIPGGYHNSLAVISYGNEKALREFGIEFRNFCTKPEDRILVYASQEWEPDANMDKEINASSWDQVVLPDDQKEELIYTTKEFFESKELYEDLGVKWRRGVMLVGPPGTGKTMVCKAVAAELEDYPILYVRDLTGDSPKEVALGEIFNRAREMAPCILILEDIDGLIREHRTVFLNELDGFYGNDGILLLASSNHPEDIDEALLKRPSRFDRVFWVKIPEREQRYEYAKHFMEREGCKKRIAPDLEEALEDFYHRVADESRGFTLAYLKEAFIGAMLEYIHDGNEKLDIGFIEAVSKYLAKLRKGVLEISNVEELGEIGTPFQKAAGFGSR